MALKVSLKPHEKIIIAGAVITNGNLSTDLIIENKVPILRGKDILKKAEANSPANKIYFVIQLMYMDTDNLAEHHKLYWELVRNFIKAAPSTLGLITRISEHILGAHYYKALKYARKLIKYEHMLLSGVKDL